MNMVKMHGFMINERGKQAPYFYYQKLAKNTTLIMKRKSGVMPKDGRATASVYIDIKKGT